MQEPSEQQFAMDELEAQWKKTPRYQNHIPGKFMKMTDGTIYKVHADGSWRKVKSEG